MRVSSVSKIISKIRHTVLFLVARYHVQTPKSCSVCRTWKDNLFSPGLMPQLIWSPGIIPLMEICGDVLNSGLYVYMCLYCYVYIYMHIHAYIHMHTFIPLLHTCTDTHFIIYKYTHMNACMNLNISTELYILWQHTYIVFVYWQTS